MFSPRGDPPNYILSYAAEPSTFWLISGFRHIQRSDYTLRHGRGLTVGYEVDICG